MRQFFILLLCVCFSFETGCSKNSEKGAESKLPGTEDPVQKAPAFPSAEGYGKNTVGGRGGKVYIVSNLNDSGVGSLRAAVEAEGPRIVVFAVSGTIELKSTLKIRNPYITIAGQTAPGDGICLKNYALDIGADEVIIRYIRIRVGDESGQECDAVSSRFTKNVILDHLSATWSVDESFSVYHCENITVQWCLIAESMYNSNHSKGSHGFGGIWGSNYGSYHHNLLAHHSSRNPRFASGSGYFDYRNNVIYNWGYNSCYGGEQKQSGDEERFSFSYFNVMGNYYKPGPATYKDAVGSRIANPYIGDNKDNYGQWYIAENVMAGNDEVTSDNWAGVHPSSKDESDKALIRAEAPWPSMEMGYQSAEEAYASVLKQAGASLNRDAVDARIVKEVETGTATYEGTTYKQDRSSRLKDPSLICGIIDTQSDVGGWPELNSLPAPTDSDRDGIPDDWELQNGLDPNNALDASRYAADGYTYVEKYINSLCGE